MIAIRLSKFAVCVTLTLLPASAFSETNSVARIDNAVQIDEIVQHYQGQCDAEQAFDVHDIDAEELDKPEKGALTLDPDSSYDIQITPTGKQATVLIPEFHCSNIGYGWCGSGGCGFFLIVDGTVYFRQGGFRPKSVTFQYIDGQETVVLFATHGSGCKSATGSLGEGVDPCFSYFVWDEIQRTFLSIDGSVELWEAN
jgi:hypothetical protein